MKTTAIVFILAMCCMITGVALDLEVGIVGFYGPINYLNELIEVFETDNVLSLPELHAGWGLRFDVPVWAPVENGRIGLGLIGLGARATSRDIVVDTSLLGLLCWAEYQMGRLNAAIDIGGYRGTFSFPPARFVGLSGWGVGVVGRVSYAGISVGRFSIGSTLSLQWLPINEMVDASGQRYRGRGTPFMDFSGISVSIDLGWHPGKE